MSIFAIAFVGLAALLTLVAGESLAQCNTPNPQFGDYRSAASDFWQVGRTWETYNGTDWIASPDTLWPGLSTVQPATTTVCGGHTVTVASFLSPVSLDGSLSINQNGTAAGSSNASSLDVNGSQLLNEGVLTVPSLNIGSGTTTIIAGSGEWKPLNVSVLSPGTLQLGSDITLDAGLHIHSGADLDLTGKTLTMLHTGTTARSLNVAGSASTEGTVRIIGTIFIGPGDPFVPQVVVVSGRAEGGAGVFSGNVTVEEGAEFRSRSANTEVKGDFLLQGTLSVGSGSSDNLLFSGKVFRNDGGTVTAPRIVFVGANEQVLSGDGSYINVTVDYDSPQQTLTLGGHMAISGRLQLNTGDIDLNGYRIELGTAGRMEERNNSRVKGRLGSITATRTQNALGTIDVGMGIVIRTAVALGSTQLVRAHLQQFENGIERYYDVIPETTLPLDARLDFRYHTAELAGLNPDSLALYHLGDPNSGGWDERGGTISGQSLTLMNVNESGRWTAGLKGLSPSGAVTAAELPNSTTTDDPINTATGEYVLHPEPDLYLAGPMPMMFQRYYASGLAKTGAGCSMGTNWLHNFCVQLEVAGSMATIRTSTGRRIRFSEQNGAWTLTSLASDSDYQLFEVQSDFEFVDATNERVYRFDANGGLSEIRDRPGNVWTVTRSGGNIVRVDDDYGRSHVFAYDPLGRVIRAGDGVRAVNFDYDESGLLVGFTNSAGHRTTYVYDDSRPIEGLLTKVIKPGGGTVVQNTYDSTGRVVSQQVGTGNTTLSYSLPSESGTHETRITTPLGQTSIHRYTENSDLVELVDPSGYSISMSYDSSSRLVSVTDRLGAQTTYGYDDSFRVSSVTWPDGTSGSIEYVTRTVGNAVFRDATVLTYPDGRVETFTSDPASGRVTRTRAPNGGEYSYGYNAAGQVISLTNPLGGTWQYNWDIPGGNLASVRNPSGDLFTFTYDGVGRVTAVATPDGNTRSWKYDALDRIIESTNESQQITSHVYDADGNLTSTTSPAGVIRYDYDSMGRLTRIRDRGGASFDFTYDPLGRLSAYTNGAGETWTQTFDANGRRASLTDPAGNVWQTAFDREGVFSSTTDPEGRSLTTTSGSLGQPVSVTNSLGESATATYDAGGFLSSIIDPDGNTVTVSRGSDGRRSGVSLPSGLSISVERNRLGQITRAFAIPGSNWTTEYDESGRITRRTDPLGRSISYDYDARGRVVRIAMPDGSDASYTYDAVGRLIGATLSDGTSMDYTRDATGRIQEAGTLQLAYDANGRVMSSNGLTITYDGQGRVSNINYGDVGSVNYTANSQGLVTSITDWLGEAMLFEYDSSGRLVKAARSNGIVTEYAYDNAGRLHGISESRADESVVASITLQRDKQGRIASRLAEGLLVPNMSVGQVDFAYDTAGQIADWTFDGAGRTTATSGGTQYDWDAGSRLRSVSAAGLEISYDYDDFGFLVRRTSGGASMEYVWNLATRLPGVSVVSVDGEAREYYIYSRDGSLLYSISADLQRNFYHFDETGNTVLITSESGLVTGRYAYDPYGRVTAAEGSGDHLFTFGGSFGIPREPSVDDLYYFRARWYDASSARFLSRDPVVMVHPLTLDPYQYAARNPLQYVDPMGFMPEPIPGAIPEQSGSLENLTSMGSNALSALSYLVGEIDAGAGKALSAVGAGVAAATEYQATEGNAVSSVGVGAADYTLGLHPVGVAGGILSDAIDGVGNQVGCGPVKAKEVYYNAGRFAAALLADGANLVSFGALGEPGSNLDNFAKQVERQAKQGWLPWLIWKTGELNADYNPLLAIEELNPLYWLSGGLSANAQGLQVECRRQELLSNRLKPTEREATLKLGR